ncbi:MAG TPA: aminotransferase class V-fold PLP-dependent enzyme, partial [Gaiellaceae bacterium]
MSRKQYLYTPGPTPVPPQVLAALSEPVVHHRSPDFRPIYERCLARLREVCRTQNDVLLFTASGTGAFESAAANLVSPGEPQLVISAGNFGERWASLLTAYGADVDHLRYAWGETPEPDDVRARLQERSAKAVWIVQSETSTGVVADVQAIASVAKDAGALVVVDAVSSLGALPCETDAWGLDVVVSGSQKALMTPPGLGLCAVSAAALAATGSAPRFY